MAKKLKQDFEVEMGAAFYEVVDPARRREAADSRMLSKDMGAPANLPKEPVVRFFPEDYQPMGYFFKTITPKEK